MGADMDVAAIAREHPGEALAIADAIVRAATWRHSEGMIRMWEARCQVLSRAGEDTTLGATIRRFREYGGLSRDALAARMAGRGVASSAPEIEEIEANGALIAGIRTPGFWPALARELDTPPYALVAEIGIALREGRTPLAEAAACLERVKDELGMPRSPCA